MTEPTVGSVAVDVVPSSRRFGREARRQINPEAAKIGQEFGRLFGASAEREMARGVQDGLRSGGRAASEQGAKQGQDYGGNFARTLKARLEAAFQSLPDIEINADSTGADREIASLKAQLADLRDKRIGIDISAEQAQAEVERLSSQLRLLSQQSPEVEIRTDTGAAAAELARFQAQVDRLDGQSIEVDVDLDTAAASAQLALMRGQANGTAGSFAGLVSTAALLGAALIPIAAVGAGAMAAIAAGALAAAGGLGVLVLALTPVIAAVQAVNAANDQSAASSRRSTGAHLQMASAMDAVKAAQRGLASAEEDARIARVAGARAIEDAEQNLARVKRQAADDAVEASRRVVDAERGVADAQRDALQAQRDLADARRQATRDAEDLAARVSGGVLDERDAQLRLAEARQRLADVQADPSATELERQRAQLAVDQAVEGLKEQQRQNARLREEKAAADKAGVDGSEAVRTAQERLRESQERVRDAQERVTLAEEEAARRRVRAAEQVADAQQRVSDAVAEAAQQQRRSADSIASAQQAVVSAQRGVQQASQSAGAAGGAALETVRQKMADLSPAGREFVRFLTDELFPALKPLGQAAQTAVLPGLQEALRALMPAIPSITRLIKSFGEAVGDLAVEAVESLGSPVWREFFDFLAKDGADLMRIVGRIFIQLGKAFAGLAVAFAPIAKQVLRGLLSLSERFADFASNSEPDSPLGRFIAYIRDIGPQVAATFTAIGRAVGRIIESLAPLAPVILKVVEGFATLITKIPPPVIAGIVVGLGALALAVGAVNAALALLALNPVGLAIVAIIAVVAGLAAALVVAYQRSETFRFIVDSVWTAVKQIISTAWDAIKAVFKAIGTFITVTLPENFTKGVDALKATWSGLKTSVSSTWDGIKKIFEKVYTFIRDTVKGFFQAQIDGLKTVWTGLKTSVSSTWDGIKAVFEKVYTFIRDTVKGLFKAEIDGLKAVWTGLKTTISAVWDGKFGIKSIFSAVGTYVKDTLAGAFETGVAAIAKAWEKVKDVAKTPVKFVIEKVINSGIIDTYNTVAKFFHVDKIDRVKLPEGFATGGYISGPGGPRDDLIPAMLSNGEYVIQASAVQRLGVDLLDYLNRGGSIGGDPGGIARFATGGRVEATKRWLPSVDPLPYVWGGVGPNGFDCSGLAGEVWARITGHPSYRRYFTTSSNLRSLGFAPGSGMLTLGLRPRQHVVGMLDGLGFEARSTATGIFVGPSAVHPSRMPQQWYLAQLPGAPGGEPDGISLLDPIGSFKDMFGGVFDGLDRFTDSPWGKLVAAMPHALVDAAGDFISDHVPGFADGGLVQPTLYDDGGWLPKGLSVVENRTGRPEPVLTGGQWESMRAGNGEPQTLIGELHLDSGEFLGMVRGVVREGQSTSATMRSAAIFGPPART